MDTKESPHNNHTIEDQGQPLDFDADWGSSFVKALIDSKENGAKKLRNKSYSKVKENTEKKRHFKEVGHNRGPLEQSYY